MIVKEIVQGPTLAVAVSAASQLGVKSPHLFALRLLRHSDPAVRAPACDCVRAGPEIVAALGDLLDDRDRGSRSPPPALSGEWGERRRAIR